MDEYSMNDENAADERGPIPFTPGGPDTPDASTGPDGGPPAGTGDAAQFNSMVEQLADGMRNETRGMIAGVTAENKKRILTPGQPRKRVIPSAVAHDYLCGHVARNVVNINGLIQNMDALRVGFNTFITTEYQSIRERVDFLSAEIDRLNQRIEDLTK